MTHERTVGRGFLGGVVVWGLLTQACGGGAPTHSPPSSSPPSASPDAGAADDAPPGAASCNELSDCCISVGFPAAEVGSCIQVANGATAEQCAAALADYHVAGSCAAVGGTTGPSSTNVMGSVEGRTLTARSAMGIVGTTIPAGAEQPSQIVVIEISDRAGTSCETVNRMVETDKVDLFVGSTTLTLSAFSSAPLRPGKYPLGQSNDVSLGAEWVVQDSACTAAPLVTGIGTVTFDSITAATVTGSYDLDFGQGTVSGTFVVPTCQAKLETLMRVVCKP